MAWGQMQEVLLVEVSEDFALDDVARAPRTQPDGEVARLPARDRARLRLRRWWPLTAGLVALLAAGSVVAGLRERERGARLAALPGVLAPLSPTVRELWREPLRGWGQFDHLGHDLLLFGLDAEGAAAVTSVDGATGAHRWTAQMPEVTATGDVWCVALGSSPQDPSARIACRVVRSSVIDPKTGNYRPESPARLFVLDPRTGTRVAARDLDRENEGIAPYGQDLIVAQVAADGHAEVMREDTETGAPRWSFRSAQPVGTPGDDNLWAYPFVQHGVIVASAGPVTWAFDPDGTVLGEWHLLGGDGAAAGGWWLEVSVLADGRFAVGESGGVRSDDAYGTVSTTAARDGFSIPGPVLEPAVDDGSAANILFTASSSGGGLVALDARTGARLWASDTASEGAPILLDRRLISVYGNELTALDTRTGRALWTAEVSGVAQAKQVFTDGRVLIVPALDSERGPVLTAFDPADGRKLWSARVPPRLEYLAVVDGRLIASADGDVSALG